MTFIKNVIAVDRISCASFSAFSRAGNLVQFSLVGNEWENIPIKVPAKLSIINKVDAGVRVYEATLVYKSCVKPEGEGHFAYRLTLANGKKLLLGGPARPYPVSTFSESFPDNLSDSQLIEVTVTLSDRADLPVIG